MDVRHVEEVGRLQGGSVVSKTIPIEEVERRLALVHGDQVKIVRESYVGIAKRATFVDKDYGQWETYVTNVLSGHRHKGFGSRGKGRGSIVTCPTCGKQNYRCRSEKHNVYCNNECWSVVRNEKIWHKDRKRVTKIVVNCPVCMVPFDTTEEYRQQHCSNACRLVSLHENNKGSKNGRFGKAPEYYIFQPYIDRLGRMHRLRSTYEIAFIEQFLDPGELTWEYEPKTFAIDETTYTPDFWVEEFQAYLEVKGWFKPSFMKKWKAFEKLYSDVKLLVLDKKMLQERFEVDLSDKMLGDIHRRFREKRIR